MKTVATAAGLVLATLLLSLLVGEFLVLRMFLRPENFLQIRLVDDPILGHRIAPGERGHDALGFRNAEVPDRADIIAIGDSQTYGDNATREDSWPFQLGKLLGRSVYSMAIGGYGPIEYLYLVTHEAPKLRAKEIVVGFYFGNDLVDACVAVAERSYWAAWRKTGEKQCAEPPEPPKLLGGLRDWLAHHSVLYNAVKAVIPRLLLSLKEREAKNVSPNDRLLWSDPSAPAVHTIFTPHQRYIVVDPASPAVQEGLRVTRRALAEMQDAAARRGAGLLVVLIPTKERVYCPYLKRAGVALPADFVHLCEAENTDRQELTDYLRSIGVPFVDATAALEAAASRHQPLYGSDDDGHPIAAGYAVIAQAVRDAMQGR